MNSKLTWIALIAVLGLGGIVVFSDQFFRSEQPIEKESEKIEVEQLLTPKQEVETGNNLNQIEHIPFQKISFKESHTSGDYYCDLAIFSDQTSDKLFSGYYIEGPIINNEIDKENIGYTLEIEPYILRYSYTKNQATQKLTYQVEVGKQENDKITYSSGSVLTGLSFGGQFGGHYVTMYTDGYIVFSPTYEIIGPVRTWKPTYLYHPGEHRIIDIFTELLEPLDGEETYGLIDVTVQDSQLLIHEIPYSDTENGGGNELITFSLETLTLIERTPREGNKNTEKNAHEDLESLLKVLVNGETELPKDTNTDDGITGIRYAACTPKNSQETTPTPLTDTDNESEPEDSGTGISLPVYRHDTTTIYETFPAPQDNLSFSFTGSRERPRENNLSCIYFDSNANSSSDIIFSDTYTFSGLVSKTTEYFEIIRDGDMNPSMIDSFTPGTSNFSYQISEEKGNIQAGYNTYLLRTYANHGICERVFTLQYYPYDDSPKEFTRTEEIKGRSDPDGKETCALPTYFIENSTDEYTTYILQPADYWSYMQGLTIGDYRIEYQNSGDNGEYTINSRLRIGLKNDDNSYSYTNRLEDYHISGCGDFLLKNMTIYTNGYIVFGGFDTMLYIPGHEKIYHITDDILKREFGKTAYGIFNTSIENEQLILEETDSPNDNVMNEGGHEKIIFSLPDLTLISKTPLENRYMGVSHDTYEPLFIPAGALQSADDLFVREMTSNGFTHLTLLGEEYDWTYIPKDFMSNSDKFSDVTTLQELLERQDFDLSKFGIEGGVWSAVNTEYEHGDKLIIDTFVYQE